MQTNDHKKQVQALAKEYGKKDKRLSWETRVKMAEQSLRRFNQSAF